MRPVQPLSPYSVRFPSISPIARPSPVATDQQFQRPQISSSCLFGKTQPIARIRWHESPEVPTTTGNEWVTIDNIRVGLVPDPAIAIIVALSAPVLLRKTRIAVP